MDRKNKIIGKIAKIRFENFWRWNDQQIVLKEYLNVVVMPKDSASGKDLSSRAAIRGFMICITEEIDIPINMLILQKDRPAKLSIDVFCTKKGAIKQFSREFDVNNKHTFMLDGQTVQKVEYFEEIHRMRIRMPQSGQNLSEEYLPDLAKMAKPKLFIQTMRSICPDAMLDIYNEVVQIQAMQKQYMCVDHNTNKRRKCETGEKLRQTLIELGKMVQTINVLMEDLDLDPNQNTMSVQLNLQWIKNQMTALNQQIKNDQQRTIFNNELKEAIEIFECIDKTAEILNMNAKFRMIDRDIIGCAEWIRKNQDYFQGIVYQPMIFEIKFRNGKYRKFLEHIVKMEDWTAVAGEITYDLLKVLGEASVPILRLAPSSEIEFQSKIPIERSWIYGGDDYLLNCIDAPAPILNHLCQKYEIHDILVCKNPIDRNTAQSFDFREFIKDFKGVFTPEYYYEYDKNVMNISNIETKNLFDSRITVHSSLERQKQQLAECMDSLRTTPLQFSSVDDLRARIKQLLCDKLDNSAESLASIWRPQFNSTMQQMKNHFKWLIESMNITTSLALFFDQLNPVFEQMCLNVNVGDEELNSEHPEILRNAVSIAHHLSMLLVSGLKFGVIDTGSFTMDATFEQNFFQMLVDKFAQLQVELQMIVFTTKFNNETRYNTNTNVIHVFD